MSRSGTATWPSPSMSPVTPADAPSLRRTAIGPLDNTNVVEITMSSRPSPSRSPAAAMVPSGDGRMIASSNVPSPFPI